tara:strand:+ start:3023 stop:3823 length:801 start_codon:yes stop_codon:yes gene_type:complete
MVDGIIAALIIAVVQGLTEWLPVSSSGHLVLFERILNYPGGLLFDVALHFGTLMAVFVYFGKDITDIIQDLLKGKWGSENGRLGLLLIVATIPATVVGFFFRGVLEVVFSSLGIAALGFGITGLFLLIASLDIRVGGRKLGFGKGRKLGFGGAFWIGIAQVLSLFPGISRSGATISSGLLLGLKEKAALKFAFLMSVPIIFGANILAVGNKTLEPELIWASLVSFFVGLGAIHIMYKYILTSRKNLRWFALYALLLSLGLGIWLVF